MSIGFSAHPFPSVRPAIARRTDMSVPSSAITGLVIPNGASEPPAAHAGEPPGPFSRNDHVAGLDPRRGRARSPRRGLDGDTFRHLGLP